MTLIRIAKVMYLTGLPRSSIYQKMAQGRFPESYLLNEKTPVWKVSDIEQWINQRIALRKSR